MFLAHCLNVDEDALICDFAETYHIYDMKELPVTKVALFCYGLGRDSRIKRKLSNIEYTTTELLLASIVDKLSYLFNATVGNEEKPYSILEHFLDQEEKEAKNEGFETFEDFMEARRKIIEGS